MTVHELSPLVLDDLGKAQTVTSKNAVASTSLGFAVSENSLTLQEALYKVFLLKGGRFPDCGFPIHHSRPVHVAGS
jgi:hypothetical protein